MNKELVKERLKEKYQSIKKELNELRDNITVEKWKLLSKAYKTGKKIWATR